MRVQNILEADKLGVAVAKDGSLFVSDDANGTIYHVAYLGAGKDRQP